MQVTLGTVRIKHFLCNTCNMTYGCVCMSRKKAVYLRLDLWSG